MTQDIFFTYGIWIVVALAWACAVAVRWYGRRLDAVENPERPLRSGERPAYPTARNVDFDESTLSILLSDRRRISLPLEWYPRLNAATRAQREKVRFSRVGLHWEEVGEDILIDDLLTGHMDRTHRPPLAAE